MKYQDMFELKANTMLRHFKLIKEGVDESELKKRAREALVQNFIEEFLPDGMEYCSGIVISANGEQSKEIDVIIYDKRGFSLFRPLLGYYPKDRKPIPAECAYAVIEVETELTEVRIEKICRKIKEVKELPKTAYYEQKSAIIKTVHLYGKEFPYFPTLGIVFAFHGNLEKIHQIMEKQAELDLDKRIDLVVILQEGLIVYYCQREDVLVFPPEPNSVLRYRKGSPEENLRLLYLMLTRIFSQAWVRSIRVTDYF